MVETGRYLVVLLALAGRGPCRVIQRIPEISSRTFSSAEISLSTSDVSAKLSAAGKHTEILWDIPERSEPPGRGPIRASGIYRYPKIAGNKIATDTEPSAFGLS